MARIAFVWYWDRASEIYPNWRDGLRAAIEKIAKEHEVVWFMDKQVPDPKEQWDGIIFWDDSNSEFFNHIKDYNCKIGLCLTTDPHNLDNLRQLDAVYCESSIVFNAVRSQGIRAIKAFGTDTEFFSPDDKVKKDIEYFYPATFSPWKKQSEISSLGKRLLCIGTVQPDGKEELQKCLDNGVKVKEGYFPVEQIRDYYRRAQNVIIPAIHGSERTVLEAMSCGILPEVTSTINIKTRSYIKEFHLAGSKSPRNFVQENYSHKKYAKDLLKGIL